MFVNEELQNHLETSASIKSRSAIIAEWNLNMSDNIFYAGNYRYRPNDLEFPEYNSIAQSFSTADAVNRFYTDATDADIVIDGGLDNFGVPTAFVSKKEKERLLYSLEDCFGRFRPRSGINKIRYFENKYSHFSNIEMTRRPRYYMPTKLDNFKYWTSYRTEDGIERGIANINLNNQNFIYDAAPFVVYKDAVPSNRIVTKIQTHVGDINLGPFVESNEIYQDPFFGESNQATPIRWKVQILNQNRNWVDAISFDQNSIRENGAPIIGSDGYVELAYGLIVPPAYKESFEIVAEYSSADLVPSPTKLANGTAYFIQENTDDPGTIYVVRNNAQKNQGSFASFVAEYGWYVFDEDIVNSSFVTKLISPPSFINPLNGETQYRELQYVYGIRLVVETMNVFDSTLDLIELSPRLTVDISDSVSNFGITKTASDLGNAGLPVGQLLASVGSLEIFDNMQAFFEENPNSIIKNYTSQNIQIKIYEVIEEVAGNFYYVPIKTMYSEGFPSLQSQQKRVSLSLRDLFFYFESITAPQIIVQNVSLSYAVSLVLDSIGFSNYVFKRNEGEDEEIIPYFYIPPDISVAQVLNNIAVSTQATMFFDEYNNFVVMSRNYFLPSNEERDTDIILRGSIDFEKDGVLKNAKTSQKLANIIDVASRDNQVFNDGVIKYETRSIQRAYSSIRQASLVDRDKTWIYKPALLWEVSGSENTKSVNEESGNQSAYILSAIPLNSDLTSAVPIVENHRVVNNVMDFGDGIYWTARYDGYFSANGEIVKYDAVQYSVPGLSIIEQNDANVEGDNVWISSVEEYQKYFSKIPFNGKMYPTGLIRIYSEPNYEVVGGQTRMKNGPVAKHGRGQFGTEVVAHAAGLSSYWSNESNIKGCAMDAKYIFNDAIKRLTYTNSQLMSNSENAIIYVADATIARVGDYVEKTISNSVFADNDESSNIIPPDTKVTSINLETNEITLSNTIRFTSDVDNFAELVQLENSTIISNTTNAVIEVLDTDGLEVGMYIKNYFSSASSNVIPANTVIVTIDSESKRITISSELEEPDLGLDLDMWAGRIFFSSLALIERPPPTISGTAGLETEVVKNTSVSGLIKNIFTNSYVEETSSSSYYPGTIQSSALVLKGNTVNTTEDPKNFISYIYKPLENRFKHFGTRARIIGRIENSETRGQTPEGSSTYYTIENTQTGQSPSISGGSGGLAIMLNPETNGGYYFEIAALTENNLENYTVDGQIYNVYFYRIDKNSNASGDRDNAIPTRLFGALAPINVDSGFFAGQGRMANQESTTVYDLAVEYEELNNTRRFYLYINNQIIGIVDDDDPLPVHNNMALFVRGNAKVMFENVYALTNNYSQNSVFSLDTPINSVFGVDTISAQESFQKYGMSNLIQATYLSGISSLEPPKYNIYYEEFGTIMREASYFDVRYDKAYPALSAKISPTFNKLKGYTTSGFLASAYGAEFLVFNHTDSALSLDSSSGNYLRIQGVTFTQQSSHELTVDSYYQKKSSLSDPTFSSQSFVESPIDARKDYVDIKFSRISEGKKEFSIEAPYIQTQAHAERLMDWLVEKIMKPRKSVGLRIFAMPTLQLGDIVQIDYTNNNDFSEISSSDKRYVVYSISYNKSVGGPSMEVYLSEVV
jgi:hypothetical protein